MSGSCDIGGGPAGPIGSGDYNPRPELVAYVRRILTGLEQRPGGFASLSFLTGDKITNLEQAMTAIDTGTTEGRLLYHTFEWVHDHIDSAPKLP